MNQKVISFEHHVNEVLKPKLNDYLASRDKIIEEQAEYLRLEETVSKLDGKKELRTKVDLGCNFFEDILFFGNMFCFGVYFIVYYSIIV